MKKPFVPALGFHWLTGLYDPMIRVWSAMGRMRSAVMHAMELQPGMRILELGSGSGRLAIEIKRQHPDVTIDAIDADTSMIARARKNAAKAGFEIAFREGDMTSPAEEGGYDRIYSTMVFHHLSPQAKAEALAAARRMLRPGGRFVVADFGKPRDALQWALFAWIQQPLDGFRNTQPHRDGSYEAAVRDAFPDVTSAAVWRTVAGTVEMFVCKR